MQVLLRAEFGDAIPGKLPLQRTAKPLAILEARASPVGIAIRRIGQIDQSQGPGESAEAFDLNLQPPAPFAANPADTTDQILRLVPAFDGHDAAARGQRKRRGCDGQRIVAGFKKHRLAAGMKESFDRGMRVQGARFRVRGVQCLGSGLKRKKSH